jgi:ATP-binding cassette subfamily F protein uup
MPIVTATQVTRSFGPRRVLDAVSLSLRRGERVGVVGANGSGKSTLGRILAGVDAADSGEVTRRRDAKILYLPQAPVLPAGQTALDVALSGLEEWCDARRHHGSLSQQLERSDLSSAELEKVAHAQQEAAAALERLGGWNLLHRAEAILSHLDLAETHRDVAQMSGGEQRRVALARVLIANPDLAILDEPTNHLDIATVAWLEEYLLDQHEGALLLITHDRYLLDRVVERTIELNRGAVFSYAGGYEEYLAARAARRAHEERTERNRQNFLRGELEWLRRRPKARTGKSKSRIQRAEAAAGQLRPGTDAMVEIAAATARSGKTILELREVSVCWQGTRLVDALTLHLTQGERVGVVGPNGCGKTTLLRCLTGTVAPSAGEVVCGANTRIAYLDQTRSRLDLDATVFANVIGDLAVVRVGASELTPRSYLERFLFDDAAMRARVGTLSGGERARVALAALLAEPANLILFDEPTNDLDIPTLAALEAFLLEFGGTSIVVTHDRYFLDRVATSILAFTDAGRVERFHGSYSDYLERRQQRREKTPPVGRASSAPAQAAARKLSYREKRERDALPDQIEAVEKRIAALAGQLADPVLYAERGSEVPGIVAALDTARAEVEQLMARWEELESAASA